ncbi:hypothetical protein ACFE04_020043 [Oxalis oulophora]
MSILRKEGVEAPHWAGHVLGLYDRVAISPTISKIRGSTSSFLRGGAGMGQYRLFHRESLCGLVWSSAEKYERNFSSNSRKEVIDLLAFVVDPQRLSLTLTQSPLIGILAMDASPLYEV